MKIGIIAPAKSGSTTVYEGIKKALAVARRHQVYSIFEPQTAKPISNLMRANWSQDLVVKIMVDKVCETKSDFHFYWFDKRIVLTRDVRDMAVSSLLFRPMISQVSDERMNSFLEIIRKKERDPASIPLFEIHRQANALGISYIDWSVYKSFLDDLIRISKSYDSILLKYEDFYDGKVAHIEEALQLPLKTSDLENSWVSHIQRKGGHGDWKNWFTKEDVDFIKQHFSEYSSYFGYDLEEKPPMEQSIDPKYASEYISRKYRKRLDDVNILTMSHANLESLSRGQVATYISYARDGGLDAIRALPQLRRLGALDEFDISDTEIKNLVEFARIIYPAN
jgi:hypothetical protein